MHKSQLIRHFGGASQIHIVNNWLDHFEAGRILSAEDTDACRSAVQEYRAEHVDAPKKPAVAPAAVAIPAPVPVSPVVSQPTSATADPVEKPSRLADELDAIDLAIDAPDQPWFVATWLANAKERIPRITSEAVLWFVAVVLVLAGSLYFTESHWAAWSVSTRTWFAALGLTIYQGAFTFGAWLLARRGVTNIPARVLGGLSLALAPVVGVAIGNFEALAPVLGLSTLATLLAALGARFALGETKHSWVVPAITAAVVLALGLGASMPKTSASLCVLSVGLASLAIGTNRLNTRSQLATAAYVVIIAAAALTAKLSTLVVLGPVVALLLVASPGIRPHFSNDETATATLRICALLAAPVALYLVFLAPPIDPASRTLVLATVALSTLALAKVALRQQRRLPFLFALTTGLMTYFFIPAPFKALLDGLIMNVRGALGYQQTPLPIAYYGLTFVPYLALVWWGTSRVPARLRTVMSGWLLTVSAALITVAALELTDLRPAAWTLPIYAIAFAVSFRQTERGWLAAMSAACTLVFFFRIGDAALLGAGGPLGLAFGALFVTALSLFARGERWLIGTVSAAVVGAVLGALLPQGSSFVATAPLTLAMCAASCFVLLGHRPHVNQPKFGPAAALSGLALSAASLAFAAPSLADAGLRILIMTIAGLILYIAANRDGAARQTPLFMAIRLAAPTAALIGTGLVLTDGLSLSWTAGLIVPALLLARRVRKSMFVDAALTPALMMIAGAWSAQIAPQWVVPAVLIALVGGGLIAPATRTSGFVRSAAAASALGLLAYIATHGFSSYHVAESTAFAGMAFAAAFAFVPPMTHHRRTLRIGARLVAAAGASLIVVSPWIGATLLAGSLLLGAATHSETAADALVALEVLAASAIVVFVCPNESAVTVTLGVAGLVLTALAMLQADERLARIGAALGPVLAGTAWFVAMLAPSALTPWTTLPATLVLIATPFSIRRPWTILLATSALAGWSALLTWHLFHAYAPGLVLSLSIVWLASRILERANMTPFAQALRMAAIALFGVSVAAGWAAGFQTGWHTISVAGALLYLTIGTKPVFHGTAFFAMGSATILLLDAPSPLDDVWFATALPVLVAALAARIPERWANGEGRLFTHATPTLTDLRHLRAAVLFAFATIHLAIALLNWPLGLGLELVGGLAVTCISVAITILSTTERSDSTTRHVLPLLAAAVGGYGTALVMPAAAPWGAALGAVLCDRASAAHRRGLTATVVASVSALAATGLQLHWSTPATAALIGGWCLLLLREDARRWGARLGFSAATGLATYVALLLVVKGPLMMPSFGALTLALAVAALASTFAPGGAAESRWDRLVRRSLPLMTTLVIPIALVARALEVSTQVRLVALFGLLVCAGHLLWLGEARNRARLSFLGQLALGLSWAAIRRRLDLGPEWATLDCWLFFAAAFAGAAVFASKRYADTAFMRAARFATMILPLIGLATAHDTEAWTLSGLLLVASFVYAAVHRMGVSRWSGPIASVALNAAITVAWLESGVTDPQLYVAPIAVTAIVLARIYRTELGEKGELSIRLVAITATYLSSFASVLVFDTPGSFLMLAIASVVGIFAGLALRLRSYLLLGAAFLVIDLIVGMIRFGLSGQLAATIVLSGMGLVLLSGLIVWSLNRVQLRARFLSFAQELRAWSV